MHSPLAMSTLGYLRPDNAAKTLSLWSLGYLSIGGVIPPSGKPKRRIQPFLVYPVYVVKDSPHQLT